jgi:hypothetical protein
MEREPVTPETVEILGSRAKGESDPLWAGLFLDRAEPATQSTLMLAICGKDAPLDIHLRVPWCHPSDRNGTDDDWNDCIYRVRPRMSEGKRWRGRKVARVHGFERWGGRWFIAFEYAARKRSK